MKKNILIAVIGLLVLIVLASDSLAVQTKNITVSATIPLVSGGMQTDISQILPAAGGDCNSPPGQGDTWTPGKTSIGFGTLTWDSTYKIFRATHYYAVDIGVFDNSGTAWTITHTISSIIGGGSNLDDNLNVVFMKQTDAATGTQLDKVSFASSNNKSYSKSQLSGGWLRIYYGVASGCLTGTARGDAPGVTPVGISKPVATYSGQVTITLTP